MNCVLLAETYTLTHIHTKTRTHTDRPQLCGGAPENPESTFAYTGVKPRTAEIAAIRIRNGASPVGTF